MPKIQDASPETIEALIHEEEFEIPCEVPAAKYGKKDSHNTEEHPADWACLKPCGHVSHICDGWHDFIQDLTKSPGAWFACGQCGASNHGYVNEIRLRQRNSS